MTSVRSDQLHASRNVVSSVCCDWLVFPKKEIFLNSLSAQYIFTIHLSIISLIRIKTMTAWEKLRFNQVTTLEKVIQNKIGFTTLRCVIGQKKTLAALLTNQMQN